MTNENHLPRTQRVTYADIVKRTLADHNTNKCTNPNKDKPVSQPKGPKHAVTIPTEDANPSNPFAAPLKENLSAPRKSNQTTPRPQSSGETLTTSSSNNADTMSGALKGSVEPLVLEISSDVSTVDGTDSDQVSHILFLSHLFCRPSSSLHSPFNNLTSIPLAIFNTNPHLYGLH